MVSDDNLTLIEKAEIKYISAMDKNQLESITGLDFSLFSHLDLDHVHKQADDLPGFSKLNDVTYYREIKVQNRRRYILCFNPELFKDQRKARMQAVCDYGGFVDDINAELRAAKHSRQHKSTYDKFKNKLIKAKLDKFVEVKLRGVYVKNPNSKKSVRTYQATVVVDEVKMGKAGKLDGFWLLVTNHKEGADRFNLSAEEVITPYRDKTVIESSFRDMKSFVEIKPVYVWTKDHVKAHYTCCVLSHLINRTLTLRLHQNKGSLTKDIVSHEKLYDRLSGCQIDRINVENLGLSTCNMTRSTKEQEELLERIELASLLSGEIGKKMKNHKM
jgi:transposase